MDLAALLGPYADILPWAAWSLAALVVGLGAGELFYRWRLQGLNDTSGALMLMPVNRVASARSTRWPWGGGILGARSGALPLPRGGHQRLLQALSHSEEELWRRRDVVWPVRYLERLAASHTKVIAIANLTGGDGKTALAANLAAHFAIARGLRVLILDMDAQGTLSELLIRAAGCSRGAMQLEHWLSAEIDPRRLVEKSCNLKSIMPAARLVYPTESFAALESQLSSQWALGARAADGRYVLAEKLLSPAVQANFDVVIVNAPPRLSIGTVNVLTAASHLVIPTAIDAVSRQAARTFLQLFQSLRPALFPHLALAGIALTTPDGDRMTFAEQHDVVQFKRDLETLGLMSTAHMFVRNVPATVTFDHAGERKRRSKGIDYLDTASTRSAFAELGDAIAFRTGLYCTI